MTLKFPVAALLSALVLAACTPSTDTAPAAGATSAPPQQAPVAVDAPPPMVEEEAGSVERVTAEQPQLKVTTVDGKTYDLAEHRGNWVVINFWATWCAPCRKEMPELSALNSIREHIDVVGLAYEEIEPEEMLGFLKDHPVTYPIAIVDPYDPPADFATPRGLPLTHLIDPQGKLAHTFLGPVTAADIEKQIAARK